MTSLHHSFDPRSMNGLSQTTTHTSSSSSLDCLYQAISLIETRNAAAAAAVAANNHHQKFRNQTIESGDSYYDRDVVCNNKQSSNSGGGTQCYCGCGNSSGSQTAKSSSSSSPQVASRLEKAKQLARRINDAENFHNSTSSSAMTGGVGLGVGSNIMPFAYSPVTPYSSPLSSPPAVVNNNNNTQSQFGCFYPSQMLTPPMVQPPLPPSIQHYQPSSPVYPLPPTNNNSTAAPFMSLQSDLISNLLAFYITQYVNTLKALNINQQSSQSPSLNNNAHNLQSLAHLIYSLNSYQQQQQQHHQEQHLTSDQHHLRSSQFTPPHPRFQSPPVEPTKYNQQSSRNITKSQKKFKPQIRYSTSRSDVSALIDEHFRRSLGAAQYNKYFESDQADVSPSASKRKIMEKQHHHQSTTTTTSIEALKSALMNKKMKRSASLIRLDDQKEAMINNKDDYKSINMCNKKAQWSSSLSSEDSKNSNSTSKQSGGLLKFNLSSVSLNSMGSSSSSLGDYCEESSQRSSDDEKSSSSSSTAASSATHSRSSSFNKALGESIWSSLKDKLSLVNSNNNNSGIHAASSDESNRFD